MALTVTSRGTGTHNTGATTLVPGGRTATLAVGSMGVLAIALDNAGTAGASLIAPASWTDAKGNVWTLREPALYDNGAASAGIEMAFYTAPITVALLTTDAGTMTWAGGASPVAKAWTWYEVIPGAGNSVAYSTGGTIAGATAANAQVVTASVLVGDAVIAGYFSENVAAVTGDSDSTNGTWTAQQTATVGTTTSGVRIATQQKVQTTTPSTQSYDATVSSQDRIAGYIMLHEVVNTTVTPGVASLSITTFAAAIRLNKIATPAKVSLALTTFAPVVQLPQRVTPGLVALALTPFAPVAATPRLVTPGKVSLMLTPLAPTVSVESHGVTVTPDTASLALSVFAPTIAVSDNKHLVPGVASLSLSLFAPAVATPRVVTPATLSLALTPYSASVVATDPKTVVPGTRSLSLTSFAPGVHAGVTVFTGVAELTLAGLAPDVVLTDNKLVTPPAANLVLATFAAAVLTPRAVTPGTVDLLLAGLVPSVFIDMRAIPGVAALSLAAFAPDVSAGGMVLVMPETLTLVLATYPPIVNAIAAEPLPAILRGPGGYSQTRSERVGGY